MIPLTWVSKVFQPYIYIMPLLISPRTPNHPICVVTMSKCRVLRSATQKCSRSSRNVHRLLMDLSPTYFGQLHPLAVVRASFQCQNRSRCSYIWFEALCLTSWMCQMEHFNVSNTRPGSIEHYYSLQDSQLSRQQCISAGAQVPRQLPFRGFRPK